jgi:protein gp37
MKNIEWADRAINPITGCTNCENGMCQGKFKCYAEGFARRLAGKERKHPGSTGYPTAPGQHFRPTYHPDKLTQILKLPKSGRPKRVFLDSMSDWFCEGVPAAWAQHIIDAIWLTPQHRFMVLTKRPERILEMLHCIDLPTNLWMGVSVTCQEDVWRIQALKEALPGVHKFVSFEPLLGPIKADLTRIEWAIVGRETGNQKSRTPIQRSWVDGICEAAISESIPAFLKGRMCGPRRDGQYVGRQEFPEELR